MRIVRNAWCIAGFAIFLASPVAQAEGDELLQKVVIVSRHGVRAPIPGAAELANWAAQPWPKWNEAPSS